MLLVEKLKFFLNPSQIIFQSNYQQKTIEILGLILAALLCTYISCIPMVR